MIRVEDAAAVRTIAMSRPEKRNALTTAMLGELERAFAVPDSIRAVALVGDGPVFCAGFDLFENAPDVELRSLRAQLSGLAAVLSVMRSSHAAIVAGVQGAAVAGGCALLGGCDLVIADRAAKLGYPVVRLGISPAVTGPYLRQSVGDGSARAIMLDPMLLTADAAQAKGLVSQVVNDAAEVAPAALAAAGRLASKPGLAIAETRRWLSVLSPMGDWAEVARDASLAALDRDTFVRLQQEVWNR